MVDMDIKTITTLIAHMASEANDCRLARSSRDYWASKSGDDEKTIRDLHLKIDALRDHIDRLTTLLEQASCPYIPELVV